MKAVLFDLDGTLIDSIELIVSCFTKTIETHLGYTPERSWILSCIGKPLRPALEQLAPGRGEHLTETYRNHQTLLHDSLVKPFEGIQETLFTLKKKGFQLGIVTSKGRAGTNKALALMPEITPLFSSIITVDDSLTHKPEAEPLLLALKEMNEKNHHTQHLQPEQCYYVGDTIYDMQAAVNASMKPVGVLWGVADRNALSEYTNTILINIEDLTKL
jgi:pyrophosphatase PpaX